MTFHSNYNCLISALAILTVATCADTGGRIYNGENATYGEFPFMVKFHTTDWGWEYTCGAVILSERWILTAAHCIVGHHYRVIVGDFILNATDEYEREYTVDYIVLHEGYPDWYNYDYDTWTYIDDIGLVHLSEDIEWNDYVAPINLPTVEDEAMYDEGAPVTVIGWGITEATVDDYELSNHLQKLEYEFVSYDTCKAYWNDTLYPGMCCTGSDPPDERHTWNGDSGSPLFFTDTNGETTLLALVSTGTSNDSILTWDINVDVLYYVKSGWIAEAMDKDRVLYFKLTGEYDRMGIVLASTYAPEFYWGAVCNDGVGRNEIDAICQHFGYSTGMLVDAYSSHLNSSLLDSLSYAVTALSCPASVGDPTDDCDWTEYKMAEVPCVGGQQLAVSCTDEAFEFAVYEGRFKVNKRGKAKFECHAYAYRYGMEMDLGENSNAFIVNRDSRGNYSHVDANMKYKKRAGYWKGRGFVSDISEEDRCFVCLVWIDDSYTFTAGVDPDCSYEAVGSDQLHEEIWSYWSTGSI